MRAPGMPEADLAAEMRELEQMDLRLSISFRRLSVKDVEGKVLVGTPVTTAAALCTATCARSKAACVASRDWYHDMFSTKILG